MPHIYCPVDSWQYNVSSPDAESGSEAVAPYLMLHGKTHIWGIYEKIPFEIEVSKSDKKVKPFGRFRPLPQGSEKGADTPTLAANLIIDEKAFYDLRDCLLSSAKVEHMGVHILLDVDGLEMEIDYVWPRGKKLDIAGWTYSLKFPNTENGL